MRYTESQVRGWLDLLRSSSSVDEGLTKIVGVSPRCVYRQLQRFGLGLPGDYVVGSPKPTRDTVRAPRLEAPRPNPAEPPVDPVRAHEARREASADKTTIAELVERVRELQARNAFLDALDKNRMPPRLVPLERTSGKHEMVGVALASDWHIEEPVDPVSVAGRNEYNLDIAADRVDRFFQAIIWHFHHHRASGEIALRQLLLWLGGDLYTGYIHPEMAENNLLSPTEAVRWLLPRLEGGIRTLLKVLDLAHIEIPCSFGNHGRTTEKMRVATSASNSFDLLLYTGLADRLADEKRVHFHITKSEHQYVQVYDYTLHFHHGHDVRYQGGVGGIGIPLLKAVAAWDELKYAHLHHIGHWHQWKDFGRVVVNGSLIGVSPYSVKIRASYEEPSQFFYLLDSKQGKCMPNKLWVAAKEVAA